MMHRRSFTASIVDLDLPLSENEIDFYLPKGDPQKFAVLSNGIGG